eukprot:6840571-Heterocapsa_arctica.AAC.1
MRPTEPVINNSRMLLTCSLLEVIEPITNEHVTIDHVRFADDFAQVSICSGFQGAEANARNCNNELDAAILPANLCQNKGKQQLLTHFVGKDAHLNQQAFNNLHLTSHAEAAKHLGSMYHFIGITTTEVSARVRANQNAWGSRGSFWHSRSIPLALRRAVYIALPLTTLISGLDSFTLTATDLQRLERIQMKQLRALLHGDAYGVSHQSVRTQLRCPTITSRLRASRAKWMQAVARQPEQHTAFLGALAGNSLSGPLQLDWRSPQ